MVSQSSSKHNGWEFDYLKIHIVSLLSKAFSSEYFLNFDSKQFDLYSLLEKPPESHMGDYAFPCFNFAKLLRKNPKEIAEKLAFELLSFKDDWIKDVQTVGAFVNIFIQTKQLADKLIPTVIDGSYFRLVSLSSNNGHSKVMVEYSQPNTHKVFHVGHGRNVCLGDSICRLLNYNGFQVIKTNYIGDEGTHVAKCLWEIISKKDDLPRENQVEWFGQKYVDANKKYNSADEQLQGKYKIEISKILSEIESKSGPIYDLWLKTRQSCLEDFDRIYKWLDVDFDHVYYESDVSQESQDIVDEYVDKGLFCQSQGAIGIDLEDDNLGFFMARKSDGTTPYITKDLALARTKFRDFDMHHSIYVVGSEQKFHFQQLFKVLDLMGFTKAAQCYHLSYAHVVRSEGKMSSRLGNTFTFNELTQILLSEIHKKLKKYEGEWSDAQIKQTGHLLALGAIKYGMLSCDPNKEIIFDPESWTSFEGNSGPYLIYSYTRVRSILNKLNLSDFKVIPDFSCLEDPCEKDMLRLIYDFNGVCVQASKQYKPSILANHLYQMCRAFNKFYASVSVLKAESFEHQKARAFLIHSFSIALKKGLDLLGITPPEKM